MRHTSTVLTCLGGIGVVATSIMAIKATPKALELIEEAKAELRAEKLPFAEDVQAAKTVGMNEHIAKPLDWKILAKTLNRWLG